MDFVTDYKIENYIMSASWDSYPTEVQQRARVTGIDLMMALILGSKSKQFDTGISVAKTIGSQGEIPLIGSEECLNLFGATLALGHAANAFDIDDGHNLVKGHPGASFVAGILAAGLEQNISYREFLTTLVVSYDVAVRSGIAIQRYYDYLHSTGAYGAVATAAGVSKIFGLSKEQINNALSVADFHAPLVPVMRSVQFPSMNKDGVPFGSVTGILSVLETLNGFTGKAHLLELAEYRYLSDDLNENYEIMNLYFKPYTCCRWAHPPIEAALSLINKHQIHYKDITSIEVKTFVAATKLSKIIPKETDEAQYNISYPIASSIINEDLGFNQVLEKNLNNKTIFNLMDKIIFTVDEEIELAFPEKRQCIVEISTLNDKYISNLTEASGEVKDNVDIKWIQSKFKRITKPLFTKENQLEILELLSLGDPSLHHVVNVINDKLLK